MLAKPPRKTIVLRSGTGRRTEAVSAPAVESAELDEASGMRSDASLLSADERSRGRVAAATIGTADSIAVASAGPAGYASAAICSSVRGEIRQCGLLDWL